MTKAQNIKFRGFVKRYKYISSVQDNKLKFADINH